MSTWTSCVLCAFSVHMVVLRLELDVVILEHMHTHTHTLGLHRYNTHMHTLSRDDRSAAVSCRFRVVDKRRFWPSQRGYGMICTWRLDRGPRKLEACCNSILRVEKSRVTGKCQLMTAQAKL